MNSYTCNVLEILTVSMFYYFPSQFELTHCKKLNTFGKFNRGLLSLRDTLGNFGLAFTMTNFQTAQPLNRWRTK